jgi:deoxycytidylate deaminase
MPLVPDKIIRTAVINAKKSQFRYRLGAVIFQGNKIISTGFNKSKSHPITKDHKEFGSIHAEIDAILQAPITKEKDLFVVRLLACNTFAISKPCQMCESIIQEHEIRNVYYINRSGKIKRLKV